MYCDSTVDLLPTEPQLPVDSKVMEPDMIDRVAAVMNEYPVLWVVYGFGILLPFVAAIACCFWPKHLDTTARRKKTDEPTPDDKGVHHMDATARRKKTDEPTPDDKVVIEEKRNGIRNRDDHQQVSQQKQRETKPRENGTCDQSTAERKDLKDSAEMVAPAEADETELSRDSGTAAVKKDEDAPTISSVDENKVEGGQGGEVGEESSVPLLVETVGPQQEGERSRHEGESQLTEQVTAEQSTVEGDEVQQWSFPPKLEEFNLMDSDADPSELEAIFSDERLSDIRLNLDPEGPSFGISIVGGGGSPNGDLPIIIKRVLHDSIAEKDGRLKSGDELVAVNDTLLVGVRKDFAINALSNMRGHVRLLALQDY